MKVHLRRLLTGGDIVTIKPKSLEVFLIYMTGFLLLWEWLRPLEVIVQIQNLQVFVVFLAIGFLLYFFQLRWIFKAIILSVYMVLTINHIFFNEPFITIIFPVRFLAEIANNIGHVFAGDWLAITDAFRTLLLFILLWLLIYLLNYWLVIRKTIFFFLVLTIVYLAVVDTFFPYEANWAIVRTMIIGLLAVGLLFVYKLIEQEKILFLQQLKNWVIPLIVIVLFSTTIGVMIPKAGPVWPDPVPFIQSMADHHPSSEGEGTGNMRRIGYDEDDSRLGGPFEGDNTPVFRIESSHAQYWRVETKDMYTGKGWESSNLDERVEIVDEMEIPMYTVEPSFEEKGEAAKIEFQSKKDHIVYPYGVKQLNFDTENSFEYNLGNEKIYTGSLQNANSYEVQYNRPAYEVYTLRSVENYTQLINNNLEFYERYTQLPENLPGRIHDLALELTESKTNIYEKVKAIESYLSSYRFTYDTKNVVYPGKDQDYVDQFLFETMIGYCDNFSTSMVVLLRTLGIPSRWAKGYTKGTMVGHDENTSYFELTNNDAHSWVEVYFPNIGWVPFEPTKGFNNPTEFYYDLQSDQHENSRTAEDVQPPPEEEKEQLEKEEKKEKESEKDKTEQQSTFSWGSFWDDTKWWWFGSGVFSLITLLILILTKNRWLPYWTIFRFRNMEDGESFANAYLQLIKSLERSGLKIEDGATLRQYAKYVDGQLGNEKMSELTNYYELFLYRKNEHAQASWESLKEIWESLMKQVAKKKQT